MDEINFRKYLVDRKVPPDEIEQNILLAREFESFLLARSEAGLTDDDGKTAVNDFSAILIRQNRNTLENYLTLVRYSRFIHNPDMTAAAIEVVDGAEVLDNLRDHLGRQYGEALRDEVFQGVEMPGLGATNERKSSITAVVIERLERAIGSENSREFLSGCLRTMEDRFYQADRQKYLECGNLEAFLARKGDDFIAYLEQLMVEKQLYFTQEITPEVIAYVQGQPEIRQGVREGPFLYETKIPYQTGQFLTETDEQKKRYAYCHCPWARESLKEGRSKVSPVFCQCSAGFHKRYWEVVLDVPLKAEVLESVLQGDLRCRFRMDLSSLGEN